MRATMRMGWTFLLALTCTSATLAGCLGDGVTPGGEVTELAGLKVDESQMRGRVGGSNLVFTLALERTRDREFEGRIKFSLEDLEGRSFDRKETRFRMESDRQEYAVTLVGIPHGIESEELAGYLVSYRVEWDGHIIHGRRSVYATVPKLEAQVLAPSRLYDGEETFMRVLTRDPVSGQAQAGARVTAELEMDDSIHMLGEGFTDETGAAEVLLRTPGDLLGSGKLNVTVFSSNGSEEAVDGSVEIMREEKILLTTDKPIYQPGQVIHMRLLALRRPELRPVGGEELLFEVRDGKGNKVFKHQGVTSEFGIGAADFRLATEVNMGDYEILARVGTTETIKTVDVKRYALPKFGVSFQPDRGYYLPGELVSGQVSARYFFGKPVSGGSARVKVFTFDVGLAEIGEVVGTLNEEGIWGFTYRLPSAFAGIDLLQGDAYLQFDVEVTDMAEHAETMSAVSVVAASPLKVALIPESGDLVPGIPNLIHVVTADPIGRPAPATVALTPKDSPPITLTTDERGLGQAVLIPQLGSTLLHIEAQDSHGNRMERDEVLASGQSGDTVLLRVAKRLHQVGDTIHLEVFAHDAKDRIYLDAIKGNQTLLTHALDLVDGHASYEMELTPDMEGNVQFDAYYLTRESQIVRDTQLVLVEGARDLAVEVSLDKSTYLPAETATIHFQVNDLFGQGVAAAIGLAVVDEAVFALTEFRPGLAETFFEIEQDILKPRYQIVRSSALGGYLDEDLSQEEREKSASVAFAAARGFAGYGIEKNTYVDEAKLVAGVVKERINQDASDIVEDLKIFGDQGLLTPENLQGWLDRHNEWYDPFGQLYRIEVRGSQEWDQTMIFHSAGPDELTGSPDDVASDGFYAWYIYSGKNRGDWGWGFEDGDMAGGMDPGGEPPHNGECQDGTCGTPDEGGGGGEEGQGQPRVRSYFPETLYVNPAVLTDASGSATVEIPLADSITTWRMTSLANSLQGRIGSRADGILVFQDFFVDIDFPATLTRGDRVSVPVAVYNYLEEPQTISLEVQQEGWLILEDSATKSVSLEAGEVSVVYFTMTMREVGWHGLTVYAYGSEASDAVRRTVEIVPDGKEFRVSESDRLGEMATRSILVPEEAIDGASRIFVKVYPGLMSQAVEGLDALLRIPNGCFEQTTTTAWPNIMVLNYLQKSGQLTPAIELKARDYVNQSYQRIVTFECPSGGFNWWVGDDPGNAILTAMALMMFADAQEVVDIDEDLVRRSEEDLLRDQQADGSWSGESHLHAGFEIYGESQLRSSAFCTWGLAMSGYRGPETDLAVSYLKSALPGTDDLYTQALVGCALAWYDAHDPTVQSLLNELDDRKQLGDNGVIYWSANTSTASGACGNNADMETTALITQAMIQAGMYPETVNGAITWLIQQKDSFGMWSSTQATVQSLRAMAKAMDYAASQDVNGTARVSINGVDDVCTFDITPDNSDVTRICELNAFTVEGENSVAVSLNGQGTFLYQVVGVYYLPWSMVSDSPDGPLSIDVSYDRTNLGVDETVTVEVTVSYNVPDEKASMIMIDMGIPPGFDVLTEDLAELVQTVPTITRFEIRGRQLSIYLDELAYGSPLTFEYRMKARFPIQGQTPESSVWAYYNPETRATAKPVTLLVEH